MKYGRGGASITIGQFFSLKGRTAATKHVFAGSARLASKLLPPGGYATTTAVATLTTTSSTSTGSGNVGDGLPNTNGCEPSDYQPQKCPILPNGEPVVPYPFQDTKVRPETYYYHPDHLGSTSWVTDQNGKVREHVEYFPYGEVWREPKSDRDGAGVKGQRFLFSGKELDEETGLYYFGARYYDPVRVRWASTDPMFDRFLGSDPRRLRNGGVFRPATLSLYGFVAFMPRTRLDPDGMADVRITISGAPNGRHAYTWAYPDGNPAVPLRTPLYNITVSAKGEDGVVRSKQFEGVRFGPTNDRGQMSVSGLAERQTHRLSWYPGYALHSTDTAENGAWIVYGNFLIHDGGDRPSDLVGTKGCVELYGPKGFSRFNQAILDLSGERRLADVKATAHYEAAKRPGLQEFVPTKPEALGPYVPPR